MDKKLAELLEMPVTEAESELESLTVGVLRTLALGGGPCMRLEILVVKLPESSGQGPV